MAVWTIASESENLLYSVSHDNGLSWSSETILNQLVIQNPSFQDGGSIVTYSHGVFMAVWYGYNPSNSVDPRDVRLSPFLIALSSLLSLMS